MPAPTRKSRPSKPGSTMSTRRFVFQSFTQKISNIKIDPIRRVRRYVDDEETQKSCFRPALESWLEMNLSSNFSQFSKEILPLTDSLPHILHYQNQIMELLSRVHDLTKEVFRVTNGLENSLMAQFARDLGEVFEDHFIRAVTLLSSIVAEHNDVSVIEWSFNCLAFLLKYLSRLLVPDLRPLFNILSPLLGKAKQKPFVIRFAAEALSFLVRKSKGEHLRAFILYVLSDFEASHNSKQYGQGLSSLFIESCVSIHRTVHSKGAVLVKILCEVVDELGGISSPAFRVLEWVLVGLIHHTELHTFSCVQDTIYGFVHRFTALTTADRFEMGGRLLHIIFTVRKGNRVSNWETGAKLALELLDSAISIQEEKLGREIVKACAVLLQTADMSIVISKGTKLVDRLQKYQNGTFFLSFCDLFSRLGDDRFQAFLLPFFQQFVCKHWASYELVLLDIVPKLSIKGLLMRMPYSEGVEELPGNTGWIEAIGVSIHHFSQALDGSDLDLSMDPSGDRFNDLPIIWAKLEILSSLVSRGKVPTQLADATANLMRILLRCCTSTGYQCRYAALYCKLLSVSCSLGLKVHEEEAWKFILGRSSVAAGLIPVLKGVNDFLYIYELKPLSDSSQESQLHDALLDILRSPNGEARELALMCLGALFRKQSGTNSEIVELSLLIERSKPSLETAKDMAMYIRRLGCSHGTVPQNSWIARFVPTYLFGLLTLQFSPILNDIIEALRKVVEKNADIVATLAFDWLENCSSDIYVHKTAPSLIPSPLTPFECSNLRNIEKESDQCFASPDHIQAALNKSFNETHQSLPLPTHIARMQALKVLCEFPYLAEKRSRQLVPIFLQLAGADLHDEGQEKPEESSHGSWSKKDRLAMLTLFSKFTNPKVLYRSESVYGALLYLLHSGDSRVQLSALKCIFTWKMPALHTYASNLENLLDESLFRDELTKFIQVEEQESIIQSNHRNILMPVLLRILYGRALSRRNSNSGGKGMQSRRVAILASIVNLWPEEQQMFIDISLSDFAGLHFIDKSQFNEYKSNPHFSDEVKVPLRKQIGFLRMSQDMLKQLGSNLLPFVPKLLDALLYCLLSSQYPEGPEDEEEVVVVVEEVQEEEVAEQEEVEVWKGGSRGELVKKELVEVEEGKEVEGGEIDWGNTSASKSDKIIRQGGLRVLKGLFTNCPTFLWTPYLPLIFSRLISPRLEFLPLETSQGPSSLLQLLSSWTSSHHTVFFLTRYDSTVIPQITECFVNLFTRDEVFHFIFAMLQKIVEIANSNQGELIDISKAVKEDIIKPYINCIFTGIASLLERNPSKEVLESGIETVSQLAPFVSTGFETTQLVSICVLLLKQPSRRVSPRTKNRVLKIMRHFMPSCMMEKDDELFEGTFHSISLQFGYFKDRESREILCAVFSAFAARDHSLLEVDLLCQQLNSFSTRRIDEPDFERRLQAFTSINEEKYRKFDVRQWLPLVYNMLYFIKDNEELAIRTNASFTLRRFVETCSSICGSTEKGGRLNMLDVVVLPAVRAGIREASELVRMEYVNIMSCIVKSCDGWEKVSDMKPLLMGDEEANFFYNILHIQQHRRARALGRLATIAQRNALSSSNIAHFFIPLIEHFIFDQDDKDAHQLAAQSITTISSLAEQLSWSQFKALFKRYIGYMKAKPELEKTVIKLVGIVVDALTRAWAELAKNHLVKECTTTHPAVAEEGDIEMKVEITSAKLKNSTLPACDKEGDIIMNPIRKDGIAEEELRVTGCLAGQLPEQHALANELLTHFIPGILEYSQHKDETAIALRVPIAVSHVKLLKLLPESLLHQKLSGVLTGLCHILRSRAQDSRDMTRRALTEIALLLGSKYFPFILKELRGALTRGYQLHVLSYTLHYILVTVVPVCGRGALDYCLPEMMEVVMDDIFGVIGMEKDAEGYISKMKEVKSSKSYDSAELLASTSSLSNLYRILHPIQSLLQQNVTLKVVKKIDELLRRIGLGLLKNEAVNSQDFLVFCYEVVQEGYRAVAAAGNPEKPLNAKVLRYFIDAKSRSNTASATTSSYAHKVIRFGLDSLRVGLRKYDTLITPPNLSGWIPIIGEAILSSNEEIRISALRLLTAIIHVQLPSIDEGVPIFVKQCLNFISSCPSTGSEIAQTSLKLTAAILRERQHAVVKDDVIACILTRIKPDLVEPDRQGVTFTFIKAVLFRKIKIPEVYEIVDEIAQILVTNHSRAVRDLARGTYIQFLMEYPQGKDRLRKQYAFLMKNLDFPHQSGRSSVLETVNLLIMKLGGIHIQGVIESFFVPLVMVLVNDESVECREMVGALIKILLKRADNDRLSIFKNLMKQWLNQDEQKTLVRLALQLYGLLFEVLETLSLKEVHSITPRLLELLHHNTEELMNWELVYFSLQVWSKIAQLFPDFAFSGTNHAIWQAILTCLSYPHSWVRLSSARLSGLYFAEFAKSPLETLPLENGNGIVFDGRSMVVAARKSSAQLNSSELTEDLALQVVKNLLFLGRCFHANKVSAPRITSEEGGLGDRDDVAQDNEDTSQKSALLWLLGRISSIIRNESNVRKNVLGKSSAVRWLAAMVQVIPGDELIPIAPTVIMPLYNLIDSPENGLIKDLKALAQETLELLQSRVGVTAYTQAYSKVKEAVQEKRRERKYKRSIQQVADPEKAAVKKMRKNERKKVVRKKKASEHRVRRRGA